jgi:hypothetical protein
VITAVALDSGVRLTDGGLGGSQRCGQRGGAEQRRAALRYGAKKGTGNVFSPRIKEAREWVGAFKADGTAASTVGGDGTVWQAAMTRVTRPQHAQVGALSG